MMDEFGRTDCTMELQGMASAAFFLRWGASGFGELWKDCYLSFLIWVPK